MKTIKTIMILVFLSLIVSYGAKAQSFQVGLKGGVNFSNMLIDDIDDENIRTGFHVGVLGKFLGANEVIGFQPELLYSTKGSKGQYDFADFEGEQKFNLNYIDLPLMLLIRIGVLDINLGAYASYLINSSVSTDGDFFGENSIELEKDNFNSLDYGLVGGVALNFDIISIGARYNYGLRKVAADTDAELFLGDAKNNVAQVFIAFLFNNE